MRITALAAVAFLILNHASHAETLIQIRVLSPGVTAAGIRALGMNFTKSNGTIWENGPDIALTSAPVGQIQKDVTTTSADVVVLPTDDMNALEKSGALMKGTNTRLGHVGFGVAVRVGEPSPDISTPAKFRAALRAAKAVAYTDPARGSLGGDLIARLLSRPEYSDVKSVISGNGAKSVARGDADIAVETMGTLIPTYGAKFVGLVPDGLLPHLYFSIGVLANAPAPKEALAFEHYVLRPQAVPVWKAWGVVR